MYINATIITMSVQNPMLVNTIDVIYKSLELGNSRFRRVSPSNSNPIYR